MKTQNHSPKIRLARTRFLLPSTMAGFLFLLGSGACSNDPEELVSVDASGGNTTASSGGVDATGAGPASGGTGGTAQSGGASASGGASSSGGSNTGGQSGTGGEGNAPGVVSGLPLPPTANVAVPSGTAGGLRVLNWAGFKSAYSFNFDDAHSSQLEHYDELKELDVPMTFYLTTNWVSDPDAWKVLVADGHEIGNHSVSHPGTASAEEIDNATKFIQEKIGVTARSFAAPNGNNSWVAPTQSRMLTNRMLGSSIVAANGNTGRHNLPCYIPSEGASANEMNGHVDSADNAGGWGLSLVHSFQAGSSYQPVSISEFTATVRYAKDKGDMWLDTVLEVSAYWIAQKLISDATPTTNGADKIWTWTLPDHFPPGRYVRVTVDGGRLSQEGLPLTWDEHGFYEVALDTGSLTLSP